MKNYKVTLCVIFLFCVAGIAAVAQPPKKLAATPPLGNIVTANQVALHMGGFLPLHLGRFENQEEKDEAGKIAQRQIVKHDNYMTYYNAAVIYATPTEPGEGGLWVPLKEHDAANALRYATKAISLSPKTPDMYYLRGEVYYRQGVMSKEVDYGVDVRSHDFARRALADYEIVAKLKPSMAPYSDMGALADALGMKEKAAHYRDLGYAEQAAAEKRQKEQQLKVIREMRKKLQKGGMFDKMAKQLEEKLSKD